MQRFGFATKRGLGIDIAGDAIHAVELLAHAYGYTVTGLATVQLPNLVIVDDQVSDLAALIKALEQLRKRITTSMHQVVAALPTSQIASKQLFMSADLTDAAIAEKLEAEVETLMPLPSAEVCYDFESLGADIGTPDQQRILLTASRTLSVYSRIQALERAGFETLVMDVNSQSMLRVCNHLLPHLAPEISASPYPIVVVDMGAETLQLMVIEHAEISFTERHNSSAIAADCSAAVVDEITSHIDMLHSHSGNQPLAGLVMINTAATLPQLGEAVGQQINLPVVVLNPFEHFALPERLSQYHQQGPIFVVAMGLALRSFVPWHR